MNARRAAIEAKRRDAMERVSRAEQKIAEAAEKAARAKYQIALAEKRLFRAVASSNAAAAADAAEEEVERRVRAWWDAVRARRRAAPVPPLDGNAPPGPARPAAPDAQAAPDYLPPEDDPLKETRKYALGLDLVGLAFSGGGIRSATFCLGVLQGLAQLRLLGMIDFLSTVSGGGYIGSWFAAWVRREGSLINVEKQLSPNRVSQAQANRFDPDTGAALGKQSQDEEPEPVHHLRAYSRYLSPRAGLFSADTWTLLTIYARNVFVNALFFLPLAFAFVFGWKWMLHGYDADFGNDIDDLGSLTLHSLWIGVYYRRFWLTLVFLLTLVLASGGLAWAEENLYEAERDRRLRDGYAEWPLFTYLGVVLPFFIMSLVSGWIFSLNFQQKEAGYEGAEALRYFGQNVIVEWLPHGPLAQFAITFGALSLGPSLLVRLVRWLHRCWLLRKLATFNWRGVFANVVLALLFGAGLYLVLANVIWPLSFCVNRDDGHHLKSPLSFWLDTAHPAPAALCLLHSIGLPLTFGAVILGGFVEMAVLGRVLSEYEREWRSRMAAILLMIAAAWLLMAIVVFVVPWAFSELENVPGTNVKAFLTGLWAAISGAGAWIARRAAPPGETSGTPKWIRVLMLVAPIIFLIGLFAGVASLGQDLVQWSASKDFLSRWDLSKPIIKNDFFAVAVSWPWINLFFVVAGVALFLFFGLLINVNRFSLHMLYANRLTRCYLGASARKQGVGSLGAPTGVHEPGQRPSRDKALWPRQANRFTGFDPLDDLPLSELLMVGGSSLYTGPISLINCAINCLAGDELAYQDRRADAFMMAADWCGGRLTGYARTPRGPRRADHLTLGRVMTVSGAAVDPNMNIVSPPLTALMTLFNTRLGWWLENPNPRHRPSLRRPSSPWTASEPALGTRLLWEFLGLTNESSQYIHVSDGGHFENLGVYELIRLRCRFIVVADAGTDRVAASDNMAAMLRLIRTDFGIRVELDPAKMQIGGTNGYSAWHCCVGRIRYDEVDEKAVPGLLVYLQATLTGDEPPDLLQYVSRHPSFPRQSTVDQFFDEAQFEAYRTLGHHVATQVFGDCADAWTGAAPSPAKAQTEVRNFFARVQQQWLPPLECSSGEWLAAAKAALDLEQHFDGKSELRGMTQATYPEIGSNSWQVLSRDVPQFHAVNQTLQVMELAWSSMKLTGFHTHPGNRGWMNTFRRWTASRELHRYWPFLRAEYSRPFVRFCEDILNLQPTDSACRRIPPPPFPADLQNFVRIMDVQFGYEWSNQLELLRLPAAGFPRQGFIQNTLARAFVVPNIGLAWVISQGESLPCGVACVASTLRQRILEPQLTSPMDEAEFLIWLRGPYRSMGIGRQAAAEILHQIDEECALCSGKLRNLVAYYPLLNGTVGSEQQRWMDFFFDLGFRRHRQHDQEPGAQFVVVKRQIG